MGDGAVHGTTAEGFEPVREAFDAYLADDPGYSAQLCVVVEGERAVDLWGGPALTADSVTGVFSVTKGASAIAAGTLVSARELDLSRTVVDYWPEFGAHGKDRLLVRQLLSHQAGLVDADPPLTVDEFLEPDAAAARLAAAAPVWEPGTSFGYHARTIGVLIGELVRRVTGVGLHDYFEERVRAPLEADFYIGLPEAQEHRFVPVGPMTAPAADAPAFPALGGDGVSALSMGRLRPGGGGLADPPAELTPNNARARRIGWTSGGAIASARGIAALYAAVLGGERAPLFDAHALAEMSRQQVWGPDRVLTLDMSFAAGFMKPIPRMDFGSYRAFGHDGAGGALGLADPMYGIALGYVPHPIPYPGGADARAIALSKIVRECVAGRAPR